MTGRLCLVCCSAFRREVETAVAAEGWSDVAVASFASQCGRPPMTWADIRALAEPGAGEVIAIGRACLAGLPPHADGEGAPACRTFVQAECFDLVAGPTLVADLIAGGAYLMTPSWLAAWPAKLAQMGFAGADDEAARFFQEFAQELVLLDTGVGDDMATAVAELSGALGLPARRIAVGLDRTRAVLARLIAERRLVQARLEATARARDHAAALADHVSAMQFLQRLAQFDDEAAVIDAITELFRALFAPGTAAYLPVVDGALAPGSAPADAVAEARGLAGDWAWTASGSGFAVRIGDGEETVGVVVADRLAFPEHRERYLNLALFLPGVCALAIRNARSYQRLKQTTAALAVARDQAEAASTAKSQFIANMSHELRTPLNAVLGFADLLAGSECDPKRRRQLETISNAGTFLLGLIQDILDLSRLEAGRVRVAREPFEVRAEIATILDFLGDQARKKGLLLSVDIEPAVPHRAVGDPGMLRQILINLVGNALKFTESGSVTLAVERGAPTDTGLVLTVHVTDTGIGIAPEHHERIFRMFEQEDDTMSWRYGGTGLGLSIVKELVTLMGGRIWVASTRGVGSRFSFTVVVEPMEDAAGQDMDRTADAVPSTPTAAAAPATILVAEDDTQSRMLVARLLDDTPYAIVYADDGAQAVDALGRHRFDLVLLDLQMPEIDGLQITRLVRSGAIAGCDPATPLVAVTAQALPGDRDRFLAVGITDYVSKPIDRDCLLAKIVQYLPAPQGSALRPSEGRCPIYPH